MEIKQRKTVYDDLKKYCYHAKDNDFIEVTEWSNGEGVDIQISDKKTISLTRGELDAITYLVMTLDYQK